MSRSIKFKHESASAIVILWDNRDSTLHSVWADEIGKGHGKGLMEKIVKWADNEDRKILLKIQRTPHPDQNAPDNLWLKGFYGSFGFTVVGFKPIIMLRQPVKE